MKYCHFCISCIGHCTMHPSKFTTSGYELCIPADTCKDFRPDPERNDANYKDNLDRACATCRYFTAVCNIYENIRYNSSPVCENFNFYHDID